MPRNPSCTRCKLATTTHNRCIFGEGATGGLMLVGEAPGADEERQGRPFVGAAGRVLDEALARAGIKRSDVYISNVNKCRPPANRTPTGEEQDLCLPYLLEEIEAVQPTSIICLGGAALKALTGKDAIAANRNKAIAPRKGLQITCPIYVTYHPAATFRPGRERALVALDEDFSRFARQGMAAAESWPIRMFPPGSDEDEVRSALFDIFTFSEFVTCDLEWTAGDGGPAWPWTPGAEVYSIAFGTRSNVDGELHSVAVAVPDMLPLVRAEIQAILQRKRVIFHNATGDILWLLHMGYRLQLGGDTLLLAHLIDESQSKSLEASAVSYGDVAIGWKGEAQRLHKKRPATLHEWFELLRYNGIDTLATLRAHEGLVAAYKAHPNGEAFLRVYSLMLLQALPILVECAQTGVPINLNRLIVETRKAMARQEEAATHFAEITGLSVQRSIKLATSHEQTKGWINATYGVDIENTRKDELSKLATYPAIGYISTIRKEDTRLGRYMKPWGRLLTRGDQTGDIRWLHSIYKMYSTRTGRLSMDIEEGGSIHTAPRNDELVNFREMVEAPPGWKIISYDQSQVELRVIAWIAPERTMMRIYQEDPNADLHKILAAYMLACRTGMIPTAQFFAERDKWFAQVTKVLRQNAKGGNFGLAYGMMPAKLQEYARTQYGVIITLDEAAEMHRAYMLLYPDIQPWHNRVLAQTKTLGYAPTPFGRWRRFDDTDDAHAAINSPVQATGSDLCLLSLTQVTPELRAQGLRARLIAFIHDALVYVVPEDEIERTNALVVHHMTHVDTSPFGFAVPVPLVVEPTISQTWG